MPTASAQITPERLMQFTFGFAPPLIIEAAIRHRVFNLLDEGAKSIEKLCAAGGRRSTSTKCRTASHFLGSLLKKSFRYTAPLPSGWARH